MNEKKVPMRKCIVTGDRAYKMDLIRVVKTKSGEIFVDESSKANGKGIYIKKDINVLEKAKSKKILESRLESKELEHIYEELKRIINQ